ncbi:MAG: c-type cytochrome [Geminicoccaceae bacterium]
MRPGWLPAGVALLSLCGAAGTLAAADVERGEVIFKKCYACHSVLPGETGLTGPNLFGVVGRAVASAPDFDYSDALEALPARGYDTWTRAVLDAFLRSPEELVPGTTMTFVGMPDPKERADLIAWLARTGVGSGEE